MANSATAIGTIPGGLRNLGLGCATVLYKCVFDTADAALTVHTPGTGRYWAITGIHYAEASAHTLTVTSGSTVLAAFENAANTVIHEPVGRIWLCAAVAAEALKLTCSTAVVSTLLLYVQEFEYLDFNRG